MQACQKCNSEIPEGAKFCSQCGKKVSMSGEGSVLSVKEASVFLGLHELTVYEYCRQNLIPHKRVGRRILISRDALMKWIEQAG